MPTAVSGHGSAIGRGPVGQERQERMIAGVGSRIASPDLIGRERELETIRAALDQAATG